MSFLQKDISFDLQIYFTILSIKRYNVKNGQTLLSLFIEGTDQNYYHIFLVKIIYLLLTLIFFIKKCELFLKIFYQNNYFYFQYIRE